MKIALGSDHRGAAAIQALAAALRKAGHEVTVTFECNSQSCDYPDSAWRVARGVADGEYDRGILMCGSGIGVSIAANKVHGIRAALVSDELHARLSRSHNDSNVLCMGADTTSAKDVNNIALSWLAAPFEGGRHARRVAKIAAIERGEDPATASIDAPAAR
jgi:RpiB/LacA/LacB family sugar-phosphate isomerase